MEGLVLVVDSETNRLRKLREILSREGFGIMTATDKRTAEQLCRQIPVDLILCETSMMGLCDKKDSDHAGSHSATESRETH